MYECVDIIQKGDTVIIIRNRIRCKKCGDIIESVSVHNFETCSCGACSVDGGHYYLKRSAASSDDYEELSEVSDTPE